VVAAAVVEVVDEVVVVAVLPTLEASVGAVPLRGVV
jgi:hypothetical protein